MLSHFPVCIYLMGFIPHKLNTDNRRCYCEHLINDIVERALQTIQHQASANIPSPESHYSRMGLPSPLQSPIPTHPPERTHRANTQRTHREHTERTQREHTENTQLLPSSIHASLCFAVCD